MTFILLRSAFIVARCPSGTFGRDCMFTCHCIDDADCDDTSGHCVAGCAPGWSGSSCQESKGSSVFFFISRLNTRKAGYFE